MSRSHITPPAPNAVRFLQPFVDAGVLETVDVAFANFITEQLNGVLKGKHQRMVVLGAALAARAPQHGHVGVDLGTIATTAAVDSPTVPVRENETPPPQVSDLPWPEGEDWLNLFRTMVRRARIPEILTDGASPLLPSLPKQPLVFHNDLLYLQRYFNYEESVSTALNSLLRSAPAASTLDPESVAVLNSSALEMAQRVAADHALSHRLTVLSGGPGTGKTFTITRILAALLAGNPELRIGLAAPTGKAAGRMKEAIQAAAAELPDAASNLAGTEAVTVHRLLGRGDGIRFQHGPDRPLPLDVVVVDEVSMVSLPLMSRLLSAIGANTKLILVGDPFQLASVEAGAVLGDITGSGGRIQKAIVSLTATKRFEARSGIAFLADAIRHGNAELALDLLADPLHPDITLVHPHHRRQVLDLVVTTGKLSLDAALEGDAVRAATLANDVKVLCATRRGPNGRDIWQKEIEGAVLAGVTETAFRGRWYVGRPVMVSANDYLLNLFNGDTGVVIQSGKQRAVIFPESANPQPLAPAQLGMVDTWWAMTVHKSQGSEFQHAVVALPEPGSPILTREMLYTGVTRAQHQVTIVGTAESVQAAIRQPIRRATGLARLLQGADIGRDPRLS
ncbi:MAG: exodeoxyribonuclease V subunit alpha [Acidimicrobiales bacterium]|nr:exodeoxyribonuclease V subunit alpha [Acidimicrobiales bacterium]